MSDSRLTWGWFGDAPDPLTWGWFSGSTPPPPVGGPDSYLVTRGLGGSLLITRGYGQECLIPAAPVIPIPSDVVTTYAADTLSLFISQYSRLFAVQNANRFVAPTPYVDPVSISDLPVDTFLDDTLSLFISQYSQRRTL